MTVSIFVISAALLATAIAALQMSQAETALAFMDPEIDLVSSQKVPIESSGDNVYVVWFTDRNTSNTNGEVIFRASNDSGATFGDKINLSNTSDTDSINPEIETVADNTVVVTWWERANAMSNEPVMRISHDNGQTFGPLLKLSTDETIYSNGDAETTSSTDGSSRLSEEIS
jgi:hypothetical protein